MRITTNIFDFFKDKIQSKKLQQQFNFQYIKKKLTDQEIINLCEQYDIVVNAMQKLYNTREENNYEERKDLLQDRVIVKLQEYPELMLMQKIENYGPGIETKDKYGKLVKLENKKSIGTSALKYNLDKVVDFILEDWHAGLVQDENGYNLGMLCANYRKEDLVIKALDSLEAGLQQDKNGLNIGMHSADNLLDEATKYALADPYASTQKDDRGCNIGMHYVASNAINDKTLPIILKSVENRLARLQTDRFGKSIYNLTMRKISPELKDKFQREFDKVCMSDFLNSDEDYFKEETM